MPVRVRGLSPVVVFLAALLCAGTARAQEKPADSKTAAKEHYNRGTSFYDLGRYDEAIKEFEAAYQLKNDPAFLYNLAQSYRQAGNHEQAVHFYKTYLRYVPKAPNKADIEEKIKSEEQLAAQKGTGTQPPPGTGTTTPPPPGTGTTPPPPGTGTTQPPGADGVVGPPALPPPGTAPPPGYSPPPPIAGADPGRKFRIAGMATGGAGAVMLLVGIIEWRRAVSASHEIEDAAMAGKAFDPAVEQRGKSAQNAEAVFTILGLAAAAGGAVLYVYGNHVTAASETTTWRVSLAPVIAPDQSGATLRISF
jgi:tetratricopeptide (TPR) repeat protein